MVPSIAIIDPNGLSLEALSDILQDLFPTVEICAFNSMDGFFSDCDRNFVHFFVSEEIMLHNVDEFDCLKEKVIVLCQGDGKRFSESGFKAINVYQREETIVGEIIRLHDSGHPLAIGQKAHNRIDDDRIDALSQREKEVLTLMVKGLYNKEIADRLNISVATAIFHRNNVCDKLGTRSIGRLTIYAVLSCLVKIDEL